jgi:hypothetical protein
VRCHPIADSLEATPTQETVDVHTLSPIAFDAETPVAGDKGGTLKVGYYLAPAANALLSGVTPPTDAEMPLRPFLRCLFGGESCLAGSDVATGTSATSIDVTTGHGSRFLPGQLFAVSTDDTVGFEVVQSRSRSTDTVTMYPALSDTPATGRDVMNLVTYYLTNANSRSLSIAVSPGGNANRQWRFRGCTGGVALKFEKGQLASTEFNLTAATHDGPDALGGSARRPDLVPQHDHVAPARRHHDARQHRRRLAHRDAQHRHVAPRLAHGHHRGQARHDPQRGPHRLRGDVGIGHA